ncbi:MAG: signal recognition particle-docking protein FtsY [Proteobacteria bacterium]|nr:signal recognition particle-docking protein FtsY [Pseudomonadota bacterium]MBU1715928.1 signal recognition particle-docking protein FtsY [Pseudomonadota bacterium]
MFSWFKKKTKIDPADTVKPEDESGDELALNSEKNPEAEDPAGPEKKDALRGNLRNRLARTRESFVKKIDLLFKGKVTIDQDLFEELEELLVTADLGVATTVELLEEARRLIDRDKSDDPAMLKKVLQDKMLEYLKQAGADTVMVPPEKGPFVIMVLGVNGVGKTTTIGKMAYKFKQAGKNVMLVAADTFRAAASEQLKVWGDRIGVKVVVSTEGSDPSSVVYDAFDLVGSGGYDVVIVDTAGRMHTRVNLVEELKKIKRVMDKKISGAPHEVMLVIDATTGQNGISQARHFNEAVDVTGLTLTKLDGTAKGGIVVNICREFNIPIRFIGVGEQMEDLRDFDPDEFVEALFGRSDPD